MKKIEKLSVLTLAGGVCLFHKLIVPFGVICGLNLSIAPIGRLRQGNKTRPRAGGFHKIHSQYYIISHIL